MEFNRFLERKSFLDYILVFNGDHLTVCRWVFTVKRLGVKTLLAAPEWILLVALAYLVAQGFHFVVHELVLDVGAGAGTQFLLF